MKSMTGYGEGSASSEGLEVTATLRSVNHRFLDLSVRLPEEVRAYEAVLVRQIKSQLERGRVELRVSLKRLLTGQVELKIDRDVAKSYLQAAEDLGSGADAGRIEVGDLLRLPGVATVEQPRTPVTDKEGEVIASAVADALSALVSAREREGVELAQVLERNLNGLSEVVTKLDAERDGLQATLHKKLRDRLDELCGPGGKSGVDEERLAQEVALLVERADVQEEIDRLRAHLRHFGSELGARKAVGKRLDFLAQEILRELNTIGSKCRDSDATQLVLDGKVLCEQLREQVQNVE